MLYMYDQKVAITVLIKSKFLDNYSSIFKLYFWKLVYIILSLTNENLDKSKSGVCVPFI